ncbi:MAG: thiamine phosphate synthase [Silvibacterium sp.]
MQLYAITNRALLPGTEQDRRTALIDLVRLWASNNIDYIQVREKDLTPSELLALTKQIVATVRKQNTPTKILLNGPAQVALEAEADGIHLPASAPTNAAEEARSLYTRSGREAILSHACHSLYEVLKAKEESQQNAHATTTNTLILYAPVFEKIISTENTANKLPGLGLESLKQAVEAAHPIPVFALGGVTKLNALTCIAAGAAGIAAIRLFLEDNWQSLKTAPNKTMPS